MSEPAREEPSKGGKGGAKKRRRHKRRSANFTDRTLEWFKAGDEMGDEPIEGEYEEPPARIDPRTASRRLASQPIAAGAIAVGGLLLILWLLV